ATRGLVIGPSDEVFVSSRSKLFAYGPEGQTMRGWPVDVGNADGSILERPFVHPRTGDVYAWTRSTVVSIPPTAVVLRIDGSERFRLSHDITAGPWLLGKDNISYLTSGVTGSL